MLKRRKNYKIIIGIVIGIVISITTVYAATYIGSGSDLTYDNGTSGLTSTNAQDALDELYKYKTFAKCPDGYICKKLSLGDYVSMTPTKSSYTTDTSKTGYTSTQTINPQELKLWRIINLNSDGSIDVISQYVSSSTIYFQGMTGYQNFIGYLNVLASQYENSTYTKKSRHFGYNGQTEYITDTSKFTSTAPWNCSTGGSCNPVESQGGGDVLYEKDYNLVKTALGTTVANVSGSSSGVSYWTASRLYYYGSTTNYNWIGRNISTSGDLARNLLYYYDTSSFGTRNYGGALRPILTLKAGLSYSGSGTESDPYKLSAS